MTTRRARSARRVLRRVPDAWMEWPFEVFCVASGYLSALLVLPASPRFGISSVIDHAVGMPWAAAWGALVVLSAMLVHYGLERDDLRGVVVGTRILGLLYLAYVLVATVDPGPPPLSVAGAALIVTTGVTAVYRSIYLSFAIRYAERR